MTRTPAQAVAWANGQFTGWGGRCLQFVRTAYAVPARHINARTAWAKAEGRHTSMVGAYIGAPVFLSHPKSVHGHVALWLGSGNIRTTNSSTNRIHTDPIARWQSWGYTVQGWTETLNGVRLWTPPPPPPPRPSGDVTALQRAIRAKADGSWGPDTDKRLSAVREASAWRGGRFPHGVKFAQSVVGTPADGSWGPKSVAAHDATVKAVQRALSGLGYYTGPADGLWQAGTDQAYAKARAALKRG